MNVPHGIKHYTYFLCVGSKLCKQSPVVRLGRFL